MAAAVVQSMAPPPPPGLLSAQMSGSGRLLYQYGLSAGPCTTRGVSAQAHNI